MAEGGSADPLANGRVTMIGPCTRVDGNEGSARVTLGAFTLSGAQVGKLNNTEVLRLDEKVADARPAAMKSRVTLDQGGYYLGKNTASPPSVMRRSRSRSCGLRP